MIIQTYGNVAFGMARVGERGHEISQLDCEDGSQRGVGTEGEEEFIRLPKCGYDRLVSDMVTRKEPKLFSFGTERTRM